MITPILSILFIPLLAIPLVSTNSADILENDLNILLKELELLNETIEEKTTLTLSHYDSMNDLKKQINEAVKDDNPGTYHGLLGHYKTAQEKYYNERELLDQLKNERVELRNQISLAEAELEAENIATSQKFVKPEKFNNKISLVLSDTCKSLINAGLDSDCPTYSQLVSYYDNTTPFLSGGFVQGDFDMYRETGNTNDWRYYDQHPYWLVIAVDPGVEYLKRSQVVEIQANNYPYTKNILNCDIFSTPPDLRSITDMINQAIYECAPP